MAQTALSIQYVAQSLSTNTQLYQSPRQHQQLLIAETQTQGHGQFERSWHSVQGDLIFSLGLRLPLEKISALSIRVGLALVQTCRHLGWQTQLKWPNDLIGQTKTGLGKLAGILVQAHPQEINHTRWVVIGVGLNIPARTKQANLRADAAFPAMGLAQMDDSWHPENLVAGKREALLMHLVDAILQRIHFAKPLPDADLPQIWNPYDVWRGARVQWDNGARFIVGQASGINAYGEYCIQTDEQSKQTTVALNSGQIRPFVATDTSDTPA